MSYQSVGLRAQNNKPLEPVSKGNVQYDLSRNAGMKYLGLCFLFSLVLTLSAIFNDSPYIDSIPYQIIMFLICSGPFFLGGNNPRHRLLAIFMASYYLIFGMSNFFDILIGTQSEFLLGTKQEFQVAGAGITKSDLVVIFGGVFFLIGYYVFSKLKGNKLTKVFSNDWKPEALFLMALTLWTTGFLVSVAYNMTVSPMFIPSHILGMPIALASNMRLLSPLGALMFIYLLASGYKLKTIWPILIVIMLLEYAMGFLANSKELSYRIPVLLVLGFYYMRGKVDKRIFIVIFISAIPYLLFFDAYRTHVIMGARNQTQMEALASFDKNADTVMSSASKEKNATGKSLQGLKNRINGKIYVDIIVAGTDSGRVPYLNGESLVLFFQTFVPRSFWPEKPESSLGNKFNRAFGLSESKFTYVPTTMLGDFYWNFAMPGIIVCMFGLGVIFGFMASTLSVGTSMTITRFMILLLATYYLAIRFEGNFALQYSTFIRLVFLITLIDFFVKHLGFHSRLNILGNRK